MASTASCTDVDEPRTTTGTWGWQCAARAVTLDSASGPDFWAMNAAARLARSRAARAPDSVDAETVTNPTDSSAATTGLESTPLGAATKQVRPEPHILDLGMDQPVCRNGTTPQGRCVRTAAIARTNHRLRRSVA